MAFRDPAALVFLASPVQTLASAGAKYHGRLSPLAFLVAKSFLTISRRA